MPVVDVLDDTFVRLPPAQVRAGTGERWGTWLPDLHLRVVQDRGEKGVRWQVTGCAGVDLVGTAEVWLERVRTGTVVHLYVRLDPPGSAAVVSGASVGSAGSWRQRRHRRRLPDRVRRSWKREVFRFADVTDERCLP